MTKVVRIGTVRVGQSYASVYIKITTHPIYGSAPYASFSGVIGPLPSGNARGGCGQIDMEFKHRKAADDDARYGDALIRPGDIRYAAGWDMHTWLDLLDIWKRLHLQRTPEAIGETEAYASTLPDADRAPAWV